MVNPFDEYIETLKSAHMELEFFKFQKAFYTHNRIIVLGNGGSNSVASHISQDYMKFHNKKVSILSDPSMITMLTNDFGYEFAYQKFLEYYVESDTLVIIISSGGESPNMINCLNWCEKENVDYGVVECVHQIFLHGVV